MVNMTVAEMKVEMIGILAGMQSEEKVALVYEKMQEVVDAPEADWWDELTPEQQDRLSQSIEESKNPENWIDYADIKKKYVRWFKK
jgi:hypothetical protein